MRRRPRAVFPALLVCAAGTIVAQEPSYDGRRWYTVEVSIFTNEVPGGTRTEIPVARKLTAAYLPRLRELASRTSSFMIDFPADRPPVVLPASQFPPEFAPDAVAATTPEPPVMMGPIHSPAVRDSFRLTDFARDPFVDLDARAAQFSTMNRAIDAAPDHRLLWHKVWLQPLQARAQTAAVFIGGGELRGEHYELEGSLRVVDNAGGAMLDLNIWLNEFRPGAVVAGLVAPASESNANEWKIPELPFSPERATGTVVAATPPALPAPATAPAIAPAPAWELTAVWQLAQTRELGANQLYYLDHPAIGVLIQVRPYLLPPLQPLQEDF